MFVWTSEILPVGRTVDKPDTLQKPLFREEKLAAITAVRTAKPTQNGTSNCYITTLIATSQHIKLLKDSIHMQANPENLCCKKMCE